MTRVDELSRTTLVQKNALHSQWSFSIEENQGILCRSIKPDEDLLRSYLLSFRKFISDGESVFIERIHNLCSQNFTSDELKGQISAIQNSWKRSLRSSGVRLLIDGKEISPGNLGDLWINGHYFHDNPESLQKIEGYLAKSFWFARHEFIAYVVQATRVIGTTGHVIKKALRDGAVKPS